MGLSSQLAPSAIARPGVCTSTTRPASPYEGQVIYETDTDLLRVYNGTAWRTVSYNTPTNGAVLQVVQGTYGTQVTNSTDQYVDTGLSATITPTSTSSKVLVTVSQTSCYKSSGNSGNAIYLLLVKGNNVTVGLITYFGLYTATAIQNRGNFDYMYLDSPATTSAVTYKTRFMNPQNVAECGVQVGSVTNSTMTLMEIAG